MPKSSSMYIYEFPPATTYSDFEPYGKKAVVQEPFRRDLSQIIHKYLSKSFDEGAESPLEMKTGTVAALAKEMSPQIIECVSDSPKPNTLFQRERDVSLTLPTLMQQILHQTKRCWLTGGSLIRYLTQAASVLAINPYKQDYDLFADTSEFETIKEILPKLSLKSTRNYHGTSVKFKLYSDTKSWKNNEIQVMVGNFDTADDFLHSFDFRFLQHALSGHKLSEDNKNHIHVLTSYSPESWHDLIMGHIRLVKPKELDIAKCLPRLNKYERRGFTNMTGLIPTPLSKFRKSETTNVNWQSKCC